MKKLTAAILAAVCLLAMRPVTASADRVFENTRARIDATTAADGYVRVTYLAETAARVRVVIRTHNDKQYLYDLDTSKTETFPLTEGDGQYTVIVATNTTGSSYATDISARIDVTLRSRFAPFLAPSQYVDYSDGSRAVSAAAELVQDADGDIAKIAAIYDYVVTNFTYDRERAATVRSGYLPNIDSVLSERRGICFDYAATVTAMLRSVGIPASMHIGYVTTGAGRAPLYHAWIEAHTMEHGWVSVVRFDGREWSLMDPTFESTGRNNRGEIPADLRALIGDGGGYAVRFRY